MTTTDDGRLASPPGSSPSVEPQAGLDASHSIPIAVFSPDEVVRLWQYQFGPWGNPFDHEDPLPRRMHPFTCGDRSGHPVIGGDHGILIPTVRGWICQFCDYTQDWAHGFMKGRAQGIVSRAASETALAGSTAKPQEPGPQDAPRHDRPPTPENGEG